MQPMTPAEIELCKQISFESVEYFCTQEKFRHTIGRDRFCDPSFHNNKHGNREQLELLWKISEEKTVLVIETGTDDVVHYTLTGNEYPHMVIYDKFDSYDSEGNARYTPLIFLMKIPLVFRYVDGKKRWNM